MIKDTPNIPLSPEEGREAMIKLAKFMAKKAADLFVDAIRKSEKDK